MFIFFIALLAACLVAAGEAAVYVQHSVVAGFDGSGALRGALCYDMGFILNISDASYPWGEFSENWLIWFICMVGSSLSIVAVFKFAYQIAKLNSSRQDVINKSGRVGVDKRGSALSSSLIPDMVQTIYFEALYFWYTDFSDIKTDYEFIYLAGITGCSQKINHNIYHLLKILHTVAVETRRLLDLAASILLTAQHIAFMSLYRMLLLFGLKAGRLLFPKVHMVSHDPLPFVTLSLFLGQLGRSVWQLQKYEPLAVMSLISVKINGINLCMQIIEGKIAAALVEFEFWRIYVSGNGLSMGYVLWRMLMHMRVTQKRLSYMMRLLLKDRSTTMFSKFLKSLAECTQEARKTALPTLKMRKVKVAVYRGLVRSKPAVDRWLSGQFSVFFTPVWQKRVHFTAM